jgi:predicted DCC family thiol-disulfide oxidoreductase YuxK
MNQHLVFYDGSCGLCDLIVRFLLDQDSKKIFLFAPLNGQTAKRELQSLPESLKREDSLVLIENFGTKSQQIHVLAKGAFRIAWLLGGGWTLLGSFFYLPGFLTNWGYRLIAKHRHRFFSNDACRLPDQKDQSRFLP